MDSLDKRYLLAALFILLVLVFMAGFKYAEFRNPAPPEGWHIVDINSVDEKGGDREDALIQVYICGEVKKPGIYILKENDRVHQAIEMAGPAEKADLRFIEMARPLIDGETIVVPGEGEQVGEIAEIHATRISSSSVSLNNKVNINRANASELSDKLNGIGPALSQRIIDYRESNGPFQTIEDIKNVSGIGEKKFEAIKEHITVR